MMGATVGPGGPGGNKCNTGTLLLFVLMSACESGGGLCCGMAVGGGDDGPAAVYANL